MLSEQQAHEFRSLLREVSPIAAARAILGGTFSAGEVDLLILEVEAYGGPDDSDFPDQAAHTWPGLTRRNAEMFGDAGHLYVYFTHGLHYCVNITCRPMGDGGGVLLRAGRVISGQAVVAGRRPGVAESQWARGPGNLGKAVGVTQSDRGADLFSSASLFRFYPGDVRDDLVSSGPRVGVRHNADRPWRLWVKGAPEVSTYRRHHRATFSTNSR